MPIADPGELQPAGRCEWERIVRRIPMPGRVKLLAFVLATYADADGSRVRPGNDRLAATSGQSDSSVRRGLTMLRDQLGLIRQEHRGGGRSGQGKAAEYRLTIPEDLLDRVSLLSPEERAQLTVHLENGQSTESPVPKVNGQLSDSEEAPVVSPVTQVTGENDFHRSDAPPLLGLTVHFDRLSGPLGERLPATTPTTQRDHPHQDPALPPDALTVANGQPISISTGEAKAALRCAHNLPNRRRPDGLPSCAFCRRTSSDLEGTRAV